MIDHPFRIKTNGVVVGSVIGSMILLVSCTSNQQDQSSVQSPQTTQSATSPHVSLTTSATSATLTEASSASLALTRDNAVDPAEFTWDGKPFVDAGWGWWFSAADGQIRCSIAPQQDAILDCEDDDWSSAPAVAANNSEGDCEMGFVGGFVRLSEGEPIYGQCGHGELSRIGYAMAAGETPPELVDGATLVVGGYSCHIESDAVSCIDESTGTGFAYSHTAYRRLP